MKTYKVTVDEYGTIRCYNEDGQLHREDGPAVEWANGDKSWYLNGQRLTEEEFNKRTQPHREMTVAQLEKELGYNIKIVKG